MKTNQSMMRKVFVVGLISVAVTLGGCAAVQTTESGAVGIDRKQYMSGMVSEAALQQEAAQQYNTLLSQAKAQGALDKDAAQTKRVQAISQRLIKQVGVFRPDAASWN